jgi:hypothetical protein
MQVAIVKAVEREGYSGSYCAYRHWPAGTTIVEIATDEQGKILELDPLAKEGEPSVDVPDMRLELVGFEDRLGADGKTIEKHPVMRPKYHIDGRRYKAAKNRIGRLSLEMLREHKSQLSVEVRIVDAITDIIIDERTGLVKHESESERLTALERSLAAAHAERDQYKAELERMQKLLEAKDAGDGGKGKGKDKPDAEKDAGDGGKGKGK